jgi:hypothetical protein
MHERLGYGEFVAKSRNVSGASHVQNEPNKSSSDLDGFFKEMNEFTEMGYKMSTSNQTFGRINSLQDQVATLQQQLVFFQRQLDDIVSNNWLIPKDSIHGFSGYVCEKCHIFSLKPIFNIGYDMTMESRHICHELSYKMSYLNFPVPTDGQNVDQWAAQILFNYLKRIMPMGMFIFAKDLTEGFDNFNRLFNSERVDQIWGIPDRYYSYYFEYNHKRDWLDRAVSNLEKKTVISNNEAIEFLKLVKSTYAIFKIQFGSTIKQIYVGITI